MFPWLAAGTRTLETSGNEAGTKVSEEGVGLGDQEFQTLDWLGRVGGRRAGQGQVAGQPRLV